MVQALTKHWLNKPHRSRRLCFSIYAQHCPSFAMPTYKEKIYLHIMHIYAFTVLTDIAAIVYSNGTRRTNSLLEYRWCFTIWSFHLQNCSSQIFPKLRERINIHLAVMRSILCNSERKPSCTRQRTRLRSNTIYEFAAQFTNASYMVANRYSFNPKHREMAFPYGICKAAPFAKLLHWWNHSVQRTYFLIITVKNFDTGCKW